VAVSGEPPVAHPRGERAGRAAVLDLTESNPTRAGLAYPQEAIAQALRSAATSSYDPEPRGSRKRARRSRRGTRRARLPVDPDRIVLTAGTSEAYFVSLQAPADPGDAVLVRAQLSAVRLLAALDGVRVAGTRSSTTATAGRSISRVSSGRERGRRHGPAGHRPGEPEQPDRSRCARTERDRLQDLAGRSGSAIISDEVFLDSWTSRSAAGRGDGGRIVSILPRTAARAGNRPLQFALADSRICGLPQMKLGGSSWTDRRRVRRPSSVST